jgi:flavin reductase (DIM6/NTAB) family NADH-FMN oxidoreductase RutF
MEATFDSARFRQVLGHVPTGVVVVTGIDSDQHPHGITIGSFVSVSLNPPLVGFFPGNASRSWAQIAQGNGFCVNVLTDEQAELCWRFAKEPEGGMAARFDGLDWTTSPNGYPVLTGARAVIDCSIESVTPAGDHHFVLGRVTHLAISESTTDAMVFYQGRVSGVAKIS